ncbi:MAG TPA: PKD domain-containing protein, partial [Bacteroidia bacterium]|nr:PKD domain-containing protein [Bacteroidia bacterium]
VGCSPLCVKFTDLSTITSGAMSSWSWSFGDGGKSNVENAAYCYNNAGIFSVELTVTSNNGCMDSMRVNNMITVYSHPVAAFTWSPQPVTIIEPTINFTDQSTDAYGIKTWLWQFGDPLDGISTKQNPVYTYADTGTYCTSLVVSNIHGCVDTAQNCEVVEPFFTLYIPDAFTPNGDGLNDVFRVKGDYVCGFQMYIFDRWGQQLYETKDINKGWDGTVILGQNIVQEDTYIYLIYATDCVEHKKHEYLGKITVIK